MNDLENIPWQDIRGVLAGYQHILFEEDILPLYPTQCEKSEDTGINVGKFTNSRVCQWVKSLTLC